MNFELTSEYQPTGDQPQAIAQLVEGIQNGEPAQVLLGVTGSGKTFTVANVVAQLNRPTLVLSHNKTLAAQLYGEFRQFFPNNSVEYFISYYDYYQPEAYIATTNTYIEKDLAINQEIEKLRLATTSALMSGRRDVLVVASVSCIYGMGNPEEFRKSILRVGVGEVISRNQFLYRLVEILYARTEVEFNRGTFRVKGDTVDIHLPYADFGYRVIFFGDEVEAIQRIDPQTGKKLSDESMVSIFPANLFVTGRDVLMGAINEIQDDLVSQIKYFEGDLRLQEADRIKQRTEFDMEMMRELGYCSGIENYSRYFDHRLPGQRPFCLLDFFPDDYLLIVDESHATMPQIRAMWGGDRSRKTALVDYGFRLPSALDNRPLTFQEFEALAGQTVFVSATPSDYELRRSEGVVVEQIIRPTGLLDPEIEVRPSLNQIDDLLEEIHGRVETPRTRARNHAHQTHGRGTEQIPRPRGREVPLHPLGGENPRTGGNPARTPPRRVRRAGGRQPAPRRAGFTRSLARGHHGRRQGRLPARHPLADSDDWPRRPQRPGKSAHVRRPDDGFDAEGH